MSKYIMHIDICIEPFLVYVCVLSTETITIDNAIYRYRVDETLFIPE